MKKAVILFIALVMMLTFSACGSQTSVQVDTSAGTTTETTETNTESENAVPQTWTKSFYVDDFDEPTDEWYIEAALNGTFSNSATTESRLTGFVLIDQTDVAFMLYEYGRHQVKNSYSHDKSYTISVRLEDGSSEEFTGYVYSEGDRIFVSEGDKARVIELLKSAGKVKFYIYETDNSVTNYLFQISSDNLKDLLP